MFVRIIQIKVKAKTKTHAFTFNICQLCHRETGSNSTHTPLHMCFGVWIKMHWYSAGLGKFPFTHSVSLGAISRPSMFERAWVCMYLHTPVLCFIVINHGGLYKHITDSSSQQMPPHWVKICLQVVCVRQKSRKKNQQRQHSFSRAPNWLKF